MLKSMSVVEIKEELKQLPDVELDEVAALILQLRRSRDVNRKQELSELIDSDDFISWPKSDPS